MTHVDRRAFLRRLASGVAYTAPVVYSMTAPIDLVAQGSASGHKHPKASGQDGGSNTEFAPPPGNDPPGTVGS